MNQFRLPACCMDLDISLEDLFFPERMNEEGREFFDAHGLDSIPLRKLRQGARDMGNGMVKIRHRCQQLQDDGRCGIYATRPQICRDFDCATRADCACMGQGLIQIEGPLVPGGEFEELNA